MKHRLLSLSMIALHLAAASPAVLAKLHPDPGAASKPPPYLASAWRALRAGKLPRALKVLAQARKCWERHAGACGFARAEYQELLGIVYLEQGALKQAAAALETAVGGRPRRAEAWFYLGQAYYRLDRHADAVRALLRARPAGRRMPGYYALLARAQVRSRQAEAARRTLAQGLKRFSDDPGLLEELTLLFGRYDFHGTALRYGRRLLQTRRGRGRGTRSHLVVAQALRGARHFKQALLVLEEAHLLNPGDEVVIERLGLTYAAAGRPLSAARLLERVARRAPSRLALVLSEQYRLAGRPRRALRWSARIPDSRRRLVQRANIHITQHAYDAAVRTLLPLWKAGRLGSTERYRLAYAALRTGQTALATRALATLEGTPASSAAAELGSALETCRERPWECL